MNMLELPNHLQPSIRWLIRILDQFTERHRYEMGGGSVLAARWKHRFSTDIDLFFDRKTQGPHVPLNQVKEHLHELQNEGQVAEFRAYESGFTCQSPSGPVSLFSTDRLMPNAVTDQKESYSGINTESSSEILLKKIRARMINSTDYLARDLYDVVVAFLEDRKSLQDAFEHLSAEELKALEFDAASGVIQVRDLDRVIEPSYIELTSSFEEFNDFAAAILSRKVPTDMFEKLERMRRDRHN